jgi:hypothetical protein
MCARFITASILMLALWAGQSRAAEPSLNEIIADYENTALRATGVSYVVVSEIETEME